MVQMDEISSELLESTVYFAHATSVGLGFGGKGAGISLTENGLVGNSPSRLSSGFSPIDWLMLWEPV